MRKSKYIRCISLFKKSLNDLQVPLTLYMVVVKLGSLLAHQKVWYKNDGKKFQEVDNILEKRK